MTSSTRATPKIVWIKKHWYLGSNPFPSQGIARLGGEDLRENGLLFDPGVQDDKLAEAAEKFALGAAYSGLKFGFLWSLGVGLHGDARGFGKSSLMQYLTEYINRDFGQQAFISAGLDVSDADEHPMCGMLASFDMAHVRSLHAVFFAAVDYACRFSTPGNPTLIERLYERLVAQVGSSDQAALVAAVANSQLALRGRTVGPPISEFLELLCSGDFPALAKHVAEISVTKRTRNGALYLATLLVFIKAAGIPHVLLCCDQLEDFASTTTTKQKRTLEIERFRDYLLEIQPMADMLSVVVTMHPRAVPAIAEMWQLADLPSYEHDRQENRHRVVIIEKVSSLEKAERLIQSYLNGFRTLEVPEGLDPLFPFTHDAIEAVFTRSDGKPRDILRKANALVETGAGENWDLIDGDRAGRLLDTFSLDDDDDLLTPAGAIIPGDVDWTEQ
jgi:hypothetical protein